MAAGMSDQELIAILTRNAQDAGRRAFTEGRKRVPVHDPALVNLLHSLNSPALRSHTNDLLTMWLGAWDRANLAAPVEATRH